jgi:putative DNA primase/helicase
VDRATVLPIALISAPEKGCGKSVLLEALSHLCFKALPVASVSAAAMFRAIDKWTPTLFIDEVDTFMRDNPELVGVINSGHTRRNAYVLRTVGDDFEPKAFSTWCAKALSGIAAKNLTDSLVSRSIILNLRRKLKTETVAPLRRDSERYFVDTRRKLMRLAQDIGDTFAVTVPEPFGLDNRAADNWEGLVAIADIAGGVWPLWSRHAAHHIAGAVDTAPSVNQELLADIQAVFERLNTDKLHTAQLLAALCHDDESAWQTYNRGRELSAKQLCSRLKEFGIKPKQLWISGEGNKRGYEIVQFSEAFSRYLAVETQDVNLKIFLGIPTQEEAKIVSSAINAPIPAVSPARVLDANKDGACSGFARARTSDDLKTLAGEKTLQPNNHAGSSTLAGETPPISDSRCKNVKTQSTEEWLTDFSDAEEF